MSKISLRAYDREINDLIENKKIDEGISHCKYILELYPKHIDTYRLLGRAYLEIEQLEEAADIFQRILSVIPDDFSAQVGMGAVRETENNLDAAIWHIERAFEVQPSNPTIQSELRRLYQLRDDVSPPKMRLTRGALVRMYARGELYPQAIAEARAVLSEEPRRIDIQLIQAQMHSQMGQKTEAIEICRSIVEKKPYCYEAIKILSELLPGLNQLEEANIYRLRLNELDPYSSFITPQIPTSNLVNDDAILLEKLEVSSESVAAVEKNQNKNPEHSPVPDWMEEAGFSIGEAIVAQDDNNTLNKSDWIDATPLEEINYENTSGKIDEKSENSHSSEDDAIEKGFAWLERMTSQDNLTSTDNSSINDMPFDETKSGFSVPSLQDQETDSKDVSDMDTPDIFSPDNHLPENQNEWDSSDENDDIDESLLTSPHFENSADYDIDFSGEVIEEESSSQQALSDEVSALEISDSDHNDEGEIIDDAELEKETLNYDNQLDSQAHIDQLIQKSAQAEFENSSSPEQSIDIQQEDTSPSTGINPSEDEIDFPTEMNEGDFLTLPENDIDHSTPETSLDLDEEYSEPFTKGEFEEVEALIEKYNQKILGSSNIESEVKEQGEEKEEENQNIDHWLKEAESEINLNEDIEDQQSDIDRLFAQSEEVEVDDTQSIPQEDDVSFPISEEAFISSLNELQPVQDEEERLTGSEEEVSVESVLTAASNLSDEVKQGNKGEETITPPILSEQSEKIVDSEISSEDLTDGSIKTVIPEWFIEDIKKDGEDEEEGDIPEWLLETEDQMIESPAIDPQDMIDRLVNLPNENVDEAAPQWVEESDLSTYTELSEMKQDSAEQLISSVSDKIRPPDSGFEEEDQIIRIDDAALPEWAKDSFILDYLAEEVDDNSDARDILPQSQPVVQYEAGSEWIPEIQAIPESDHFSTSETPLVEAKKFDDISLPPLDDLKTLSTELEKFNLSHPSFPIEEDTSLELARERFSQGNLISSLEQYHQLISSNRYIIELIVDLEQMSSMHPFEAGVWQALGDAYAKNNQLQQALDAYSKAEELFH